MATTPSQAVFTKEVETSTVGDTVPNPPVGSLTLFSNQSNIWYAKTSAGTVTALSGVTSVTNSDGTIVITGTGVAPVISRAAITGDVAVNAASNTSTLAAIISAGGPTGSASVVPVITYDAKGRLTAVSTATITPSAIGAVAGVTAADASITMGGTATNPTVSRAALTGDITASAGSNATLLRQGVARSVIGVTGNVTAAEADIQGTTDQVFRVNGAGTALAFGAIDLSKAAAAGGVIQAVSFPALTGDITTSAGALATTLKNTGPGATGPIGSVNTTPIVTIDAQGRVTALTSAANLSGSNGWYDVTQYGLVANSTGAAAANVTAINTLLSSTATSGSTIFFPAGTYYFNAAWNSGSALTKPFTFLGSYGASNIAMTANIAGTWITTNTSANAPTSFIWLCFFSSGLSQTAGAVIEFGNTFQPQVLFCQFSGGGGTFQMFNGVSMVGTNSGNGGTIDGCNFGQCNGTNIICDTGQGSTVISNTLIVGTTVSGRSVAGIQCGASGASGGAVQIDNCDVIACTVNLLLNPSNTRTLASIYAVNSFFDQGASQALRITGAGTVLRCRFQSCYFTLLAASSSASAVQVDTSGASIHGGIEFDNCWILNTPASGGSPLGFNLTAIQDIGIRNCQIAGFTTGIDVTPNASNNCNLMILDNDIGAVGGVGANTTGILLRAGTYAGVFVSGNRVSGNTTNINDSSTVTQPYNKSINGNTGHLSIGSLGGNLGANQAQATAEALIINGKIPASAVRVGTTFRIKCIAITSGANTPIFRIRVGTAGTVAGDATVAFLGTALGTSAANLPIHFEAYGTVKSVGAGTITFEGWAMAFSAANAANFSSRAAGAATAAAITTTADWFIDLSYSATAGTATVTHATIEVVAV